MRRPWRTAFVFLSGTLLGLQGQDVEQQLKSQYRLTRAGANGVVIGDAGSILVLREDGLIAIPASYGAYWYNTIKNGGRIKPSVIQHGGTAAMPERRPLQVGEKAYLTELEIKPADISFNVQTCGTCDAFAPDSNNVPYRARLTFQVGKGFQSTGDLKQIQDTIGQVFAIEAPPPPAVPLKFPSTYVSAQNPADQLRLNSDNSVSLQEGGQTYRGTFVVKGNTLELNINDTKTTVAVQGNSLTDSTGQTWILREQSGPVPSSGGVLRNEDIIKLAKNGFDDATIIAKIESSQCDFDTSTEALIQLKQGGVSKAVLNAVVGAKK